MTTVIDTVIINSSPQLVDNWLRDMSRHYFEWHPRDHIEFKILKGPRLLRLGSVAYSAEKVGHFKLGFRFQIIDDRPGRILRWRALFPYSLIRLRGSFETRPIHDGQTELIATTRYGWGVPLIGIGFDSLARHWLHPRLLARHMKEEGLFAKSAIEGRHSSPPADSSIA